MVDHVHSIVTFYFDFRGGVYEIWLIGIKLLSHSFNLLAYDWGKVVNIVDLATTIAAVAAFSAAASAYFTFRTNQRLIEERHALVKPIFRVRGTYEQRDVKLINIFIKNVGYRSVKNSMQVEWIGNEGVEVSINDLWNLYTDNNDPEVEVTLNYKSYNSTETVRGHINLIYFDVLGKKYVEILHIEINYIYSETIEEYVPIPRSINAKYFES